MPRPVEMEDDKKPVYRPPRMKPGYKFTGKLNSGSESYQLDRHDIASKTTDKRRSRRGFGAGEGPKKFEYGSSIPNKRNFQRRFDIGYNFLVDIGQKEADDILLIFLNKKSEFLDFMSKPITPEQIVLFVKTISKIGKAEFNENKINVLLLVCTSDFMRQLTEFITDLPVMENLKDINLSDFFQDLLQFYDSVLNLMQSRSFELLKKIFQRTELTLKQFGIHPELHHLPSTLGGKMQCLNEILKNSVPHKNEGKVKMNSSEYPNPPYNFREVNVYPSTADLTSDKSAFLRPNIIHGAYSSVDYYLDVQFHLLREDFVWPVRKGISELMEISESGNKWKKIDNIKVYKKVKIENVEVIQDQICFLVQFDPFEKLRNLDWQNSKRFMHGSLLCFSSDNFVSIILGIVAARDERYLKQGLLPVELVDTTDVTVNFLNISFIMIESEIFFEPYHHVLNGLQNMTSENFPFEEYIIQAKCEGNPPQYINSAKEVKFPVKFPSQDIDDVYDDSLVMKLLHHNEFTVDNILDLQTWPSASDLSLDQSQHEAFQSALTKEFVVIQGPPGTGKTYIGLRIAEFLLENSLIWHNGPKLTPILVICFTNHALDQFLEGIQEFTDSIIRVGSQSKNEEIQKYNLKNKRKGFYSSYGEVLNYKDHLRKIRKTISDFNLVSAPEGILPIYDMAKQRRLSYDELLHEKDHELTLVNWLMTENRRDKQMRVKAGFQATDANKSTECSGYLEDLYSISIETLNSRLKELQNDLKWYKDKKFELESESNSEHYFNIYWCNENITKTHIEISKINKEQKCLQYYLTVKNKQLLSQDKINTVLENKQLCHLPCQEKWALYYYWLSELKIEIFGHLQNLLTVLKDKKKAFEEIRQMTDLDILHGAKVVGMTTTCAARLQSVLRSLKPRIVIVEEAAEVLESHIVVAVTKHCEHLILIGDHKQLRPTTSVHKLAKKFNFDTSLFERMINNGLHCHTLKVQHRMRPEIAKLIVPSIYPELLNHKNVEHYPDVLGVTKNLFFVKHSHPEEQFGDSSKMNRFEAAFLLNLARYFIQQGYESNEITILTTYTGQMFYMRKISKQFSLLKGVRITVVDNFQGEENKIILLSLVRSNEEAKIGFLKIENRVNVALSRAREGLYIVGNMSNLVASSEIWVKINEELEKQESVGEQLVLHCKNHPEEYTSVANDLDFHKVPEGGCLKKCELLLNCGHFCSQVCHIMNNNHENYSCFFKCLKTCETGHECQKLCYENCGKCSVIVEKTLACGHKANIPCHVKEDEHVCEVKVEKILICNHKVEERCGVKKPKCPFQCRDRLPCGHQCMLTCHPDEDPDHDYYKCIKPCPRTFENCSRNHMCNKQCFENCGPCEILQEMEMPHCGHKAEYMCSQDLSQVKCPMKCEKILECGHPCPKSCGDSCGNCKVLVMKIIPECGHSQKLHCCQDPIKSFCEQDCDFIMLCGHKCDRICGNPNHTPVNECKHLVVSSDAMLCGHKPLLECSKVKNFDVGKEELLKTCSQPCFAVLECGHVCAGTCIECLHGNFHVPCKEKCGKKLICGHSCSEPCSKSCPPCGKKCNTSCVHSQCRNKCGEPCSQCQELCEWKCRHQQCKKKCSDLCNRNPCYEPCKTTLKCNHPCIGFCGDPCPPLCKICDADKLEEFILGYEDEDSRYVLLEDCKHVIESKGLEKWFSQSDGVVKMKECPICTTPVMKTMRFANQIKQLYNDVKIVKERVYGKSKETEVRRKQLLLKVQKLLDDWERAISQEASDWERAISQEASDRLLTTRARNVLQTAREIFKIGTNRVLTARTRNVLQIAREIFKIGTNRVLTTRTGNEINLKQLMKDMRKWIPVRNVIFTPLLPFVLNRLQKRKKSKSISIREIEMIEVLVNIITESKEMYENQFAADVLDRYPLFIYNQQKEIMKAVLSHVTKFPQFSTQQVTDINNMLQKANRILCLKYYSIKYLNDPLLQNDFKIASDLLANWKPYTKEIDSQVSACFQRICKNGELVLVLERKQIVQAMGFKQGHWYKCPNGHIYVIADCGGANQIGKCNECGAKIGGTRHTLLPDNALAPEMDGARFPAWSEGSNMANYQLNV